MEEQSVFPYSVLNQTFKEKEEEFNADTVVHSLKEKLTTGELIQTVKNSLIQGLGFLGHMLLAIFDGVIQFCLSHWLHNVVVVFLTVILEVFVVMVLAASTVLITIIVNIDDAFKSYNSRCNSTTSLEGPILENNDVFQDPEISRSLQDLPVKEDSDIEDISPPNDNFASKLMKNNKLTYGLYDEESPEMSSVVPLPFINASPSDNNTIYTALKYAAKHCRQQGTNTCYLTFDQPLYIKGREIVACNQDDPDMKSVVVRLGGFHLFMLFLGCISFIMAGSGLKEVLCTVFAAHSVDKILTAHAFSRAVRGHLLVQCVLAEMILNSLEVSDEQKAELTELVICE